MNFAIAPDSMIEFKFAVSDFRVRLYDQFSYTQNPTTDPTATNTANLNSLTNTIGAAVDADLNLAVLSFSADYTYNNQSGSNVQGQSQSDHDWYRENIPLRFHSYVPLVTDYPLRHQRQSRPEAPATNAAKVNSLNVGPFIHGKLSRDFEFDLAGGVSLVDTKPAIPPSLLLRRRDSLSDQSSLAVTILGFARSGIHHRYRSDRRNNLFELGPKWTLHVHYLYRSLLSQFRRRQDDHRESTPNQGRYTQYGIEAV